MAADEAKARSMLQNEIWSLTEAMYFVPKPKSHNLYYKRSAALGNFAKALSDARKTIKLKPDWAEGYSILGAAHMGLHSYSDAVLSYEKGLEIDPDNRGLKSGLANAKMGKMAPVEDSSNSRCKKRKEREQFLDEARRDLRDKRQLMDLIREFPRGIAVNHLKDAYPTVMEDIQSLRANDEIWMVRDSQPRGVVILPTSLPGFKVGNALRREFQSIKVPPS